VPGSAAELAVGDAFQAKILLPADNIADGLVFDAAQIGGADAAIFFVFASLEQFRRPQQAANVVGTEGRGFGLNHRIQLTPIATHLSRSVRSWLGKSGEHQTHSELQPVSDAAGVTLIDRVPHRAEFAVVLPVSCHIVIMFWHDISSSEYSHEPDYNA
jgi:hypothetical protein